MSPRLYHKNLHNALLFICNLCIIQNSITLCLMIIEKYLSTLNLSFLTCCEIYFSCTLQSYVLFFHWFFFSLSFLLLLVCQQLPYQKYFILVQELLFLLSLQYLLAYEYSLPRQHHGIQFILASHLRWSTKRPLGKLSKSLIPSR